MGRTVGLVFEGKGGAAAPETEMKESAAVAEGEKSTAGKRLTKAEVIGKLAEKGVEFDKKERLEDLMKLLEGEGEEDGSNA